MIRKTENENPPYKKWERNYLDHWMPGGREKRKWLVSEKSSTDFTEGTGGEFTLYFYVNKWERKKNPCRIH